MTTKLAPFAGQNYLSLESFRKNGEAVRTPVWFAEDSGVIYVYSLADAWKVKRVRNNPRVRIAPCDLRGNITGEWIEAAARIVTGSEVERGQQLLRKKYGWMKRLGEFYSRLRHRQHAVIGIEAA